MGRYTDFKSLHEELQQSTLESKLMLPDLPPPGLVGMRHRLNIGKFNHRRRCGLQSYLDTLLRQAQPLSTCEVLAAFLGYEPGLAACVYQRAQGPHELQSA